MAKHQDRGCAVISIESMNALVTPSNPESVPNTTHNAPFASERAESGAPPILDIVFSSYAEVEDAQLCEFAKSSSTRPSAPSPP
jgi:hypothetical protein